MALTDTAIRKLKKTGKRYRRLDSDGLYLEVTASGSKVWRYRVRKDGKDTYIKLGGQYPTTSLAEARRLRDEAAAKVDEGIDLAKEKAQLKAQAEEENSKKANECQLTFKALFDEVAQFKTQSVGDNKSDWDYSTFHKHELRLIKHVYPLIGEFRILELTEHDLERVLFAIQEHGTLSTRNKVKSLFKVIFKYAKGKRYIPRNIALEISEEGFLRHQVKHMKHIVEPKEIGAFMAKLDDLCASLQVRQCLKLGMNIFNRPSELVRLKWCDVDSEQNKLTLMITKTQTTKEAKPLVIPMSKQVKAIIEEMRPFTGHSDYVFCTDYASRNAPIGRDSLSNALRNNGIENISPHGFRHTARTALENLGHNTEAIEIQLSHEKKGIERVYSKADRLDERRAMLQAWSDTLDQWKEEFKNRI